MNRYQRALLLIGGGAIAFVQLRWISEEGLSESRGWAGALLIAIVLIFIGITPGDALSKLFGRMFPQMREDSSSQTREPAKALIQPAIDWTKNDSSHDAADPLQRALREHILFAEQQGLYDQLAGNGKSITWCCSLSLYGSARTAARLEGAPIHAMTWNSLLHRFVIDMLEKNASGLNDSYYKKLEREAYAELKVISRLVDEHASEDQSLVVGYLANAFGCAYRPTQSAALARLFDVNTSNMKSRILPHFVAVFS